MKEVLRTDYIEQLDRKRGNGLVKIITGVRRCGKSYLLFTLFKRHLLEQGVKNDHIIALALDDYENKQYQDADMLYKYVRSRIVDSERYYILLDEIQLVAGFEMLLNSFLHIEGVDIYVTGSNSRFLSSDIVRTKTVHGQPIADTVVCHWCGHPNRIKTVNNTSKTCLNRCIYPILLTDIICVEKRKLEIL